MDRKNTKAKLLFFKGLLWIFLFIGFYIGYFIYFVNPQGLNSLWLGVCIGLIGILLCGFKILKTSFFEYKNKILDKNIKFYNAGLRRFLASINLALLAFGIVLAICFGLKINYSFALNLLFGVTICLISNIFCLRIVNYINEKTLNKFDIKFKTILKLAQNSAICSSFLNISIVLIIASIIFHIYKDSMMLIAFAFGYGIVTITTITVEIISKISAKFACGALETAYEEIIFEKEKNPLQKLKHLSEKCFKSSSYSNFASFIFIVLLGCTINYGAKNLNSIAAILPVVIAGNGIFSAIISTLIFKTRSFRNPLFKFYLIAIISTLLLNLFSYFTIKYSVQNWLFFEKSILLTSSCALILCLISIGMINIKFKAIKKIVDNSIEQNQLFLETISEALHNTFLPIMLIGIALIQTYLISKGNLVAQLGLYSILLSTVALSSVFIPVISLNSFGAICSNSIDEDNLEQNSRNEILDEISRYAQGITKNYINFLTIISTVAICISYCDIANLKAINILNPYVITAIIIGIAFPIIFSRDILNIISKTKNKLILEGKKQLKNDKILTGQLEPNYDSITSFASNYIVKRVIFTLSILIISQILALEILHKEGLIGLTYGTLISAGFIILFLSNAKIISNSSLKLAQFSNNLIKIDSNIKNYDIFSNLCTALYIILLNLMIFMPLVAISCLKLLAN